MVSAITSLNAFLCLARAAEYSAVEPIAFLAIPTCAPIAPPANAAPGPPITPPIAAPKAPSGPPKTPAPAIAPNVFALFLKLKLDFLPVIAAFAKAASALCISAVKTLYSPDN